MRPMRSILALLVGATALEVSHASVQSVSTNQSPRTWTPLSANPNTLGAVSGSAFSATLLRVEGTTATGKVVFLNETSTGKTRAYRVDSFSSSDVSYIYSNVVADSAVITVNAVNIVPSKCDGSTNADSLTSVPDPAGGEYGIEFLNYGCTQLKAGTVKLMITTHFAFWHGGTAVLPDGANYQNQADFMARNMAVFEEVWKYWSDRGARMPFSSASTKYKINVYITYTGLSKHATGFAFGSREVIMAPSALDIGTTVVGHEFGHVLQFYSGGFRNNALVGWFWECHAQYQSNQVNPTMIGVSEWYYNRKHYELSSGRMNYGSYLFLTAMDNDSRFAKSFTFDIWYQSLRDSNGNALEDPLQAIMRIAVNSKTFTGDGVKDFADFIGVYAAKLVSLDFDRQKFISDIISSNSWGSIIYTPFRTVLEAVPDKPGWYAPPYAFAPMQYGLNIIDLIPSTATGCSGQPITVEFNGLVEPVEGSDWRVTLVALKGSALNAPARYSTMWSNGTNSITLQTGETRVSIAVAATPNYYHSLGFRIGIQAKAKYAYELRMTCATPAIRDSWYPTPGTSTRRHSNGGGYLDSGVTVDATAYVGPNAMVLGSAKVLGYARIEDYAVVRDNSIVMDNAIVSGNAIIDGKSVVSKNALVTDYARLVDGPTVTDDARVIEYAHIKGSATFGGSAVIKGFADMNSGAATRFVIGTTVVGQDTEWWGRDANVTFGRFYDFNDQYFLDTTSVNYGFIYAAYEFNRTSTNYAHDYFERNDAFLRGMPTFKNISSRGRLIRAVELANNNQYVVLRKDLFSHRALTIDMNLRWFGCKPTIPQTALSFGNPDRLSSFSIIPSDSTGVLAISVFPLDSAAGAAPQVLRASAALSSNVWNQLRVEITTTGNVQVYVNNTVWINGQISALSQNGAFSLRSTVAYLGRSLSGDSGFTGQIDYLRIYRTTYGSASAFNAKPNNFTAEFYSGAYPAGRAIAFTNVTESGAFVGKCPSTNSLSQLSTNTTDLSSENDAHSLQINGIAFILVVCAGILGMN